MVDFCFSLLLPSAEELSSDSLSFFEDNVLHSNGYNYCDCDTIFFCYYQNFLASSPTAADNNPRANNLSCDVMRSISFYCSPYSLTYPAFYSTITNGSGHR